MNGALRAFQNALNVTGNNVANVNTPGYSRQAVHFNEIDPTQEGNLSIGNGVSAELHRDTGHEEMDRLVGIPDVEIWMEHQ